MFIIRNSYGGVFLGFEAKPHFAMPTPESTHIRPKFYLYGTHAHQDLDQLNQWASRRNDVGELKGVKVVPLYQSPPVQAAQDALYGARPDRIEQPAIPWLDVPALKKFER